MTPNCSMHLQRQCKSPSPALLMVVVFSMLACSLPGVNNIAGSTGGLSMSRVTSTPVIPTFEPDVIIETTHAKLVVTEYPVVTQTISTSTPEITGKTWYHIVEQGESLYTIAETECGDVHQYVWLQWINGKLSDDVLEVGEIVTVNCR